MTSGLLLSRLVLELFNIFPFFDSLVSLQLFRESSLVLKGLMAMGFQFLLFKT